MVGRQRRRGMLAGAAIASSRSRRRSSTNASSNNVDSLTDVPTSEENSKDKVLAQLEKLGELKEKGILTQEEFETQKQLILHSQTT